jgi:hypothetical protein
VLRQDAYSGFSNDIQKLMETRPYINSDDVVLTLIMCSERTEGCASATASTTAPLSEASGFLMAHDGAADLTLYEAYFKYFPLHFRTAATPEGQLFVKGTDPSEPPPSVDIAAYERAARLTVNVIVVWGWTAVADDQAIKTLDPLRAALGNYHVAYTSSRGHVTVFERT